MNLKDVTGSHPLVPACPRCKPSVVALLSEVRRNNTKESGGFWRCPRCNHVFVHSPAL